MYTILCYRVYMYILLPGNTWYMLEIIVQVFEISPNWYTHVLQCHARQYCHSICYLHVVLLLFFISYFKCLLLIYYLEDLVKFAVSDFLFEYRPCLKCNFKKYFSRFVLWNIITGNTWIWTMKYAMQDLFTTSINFSLL